MSSHRLLRSDLVLWWVIVVLLGAAAVVQLNNREDGRGQLSPWPGAKRVHPEFRPAATYALPPGRDVARNDPTITFWHFPSTSLGGVDVIVSRIASYQGRRHSSTRAYVAEVKRDNRLRVISSVEATVDGEPAVRMTVRTHFGVPLTSSFCLPPGAPIHCWDVSKATVRDTFYLVRHNGAVVHIGAGGQNLRFSREAAQVLDKVVGTWRWSERT